MATQIRPGDSVWVETDFHIKLKEKPARIRGVVMSKIDDNWFRVYSSYLTSTGEKTNIQDFPSQMLRRVYKDEGG